MQLGFEQLPQPQGHIGVFGGVFDGVVDGDLVEGDLAFAAAKKGFDRDRFVAKVKVGQGVHAVVVQACLHGIAHQHRVVEGRDADAATGEDLPVVFHVLADLEDRGVLKQRLERGKGCVQRQLAFGERGCPEKIAAAGGMAQRDISGASGIDAKGNADQIGLHLVKTGGFGVHRDVADVADMLGPAVQRLHVADAFVGGVVEGQAHVFGLRGIVMGTLHLQRTEFG